jgi:hypothetical protein
VIELPSRILSNKPTEKDIVDWWIERVQNPKRGETPMDKWFRAMHSAQSDPYGIVEWKKKSIADHPERYR